MSKQDFRNDKGLCTALEDEEAQCKHYKKCEQTVCLDEKCTVCHHLEYGKLRCTRPEEEEDK